MLFHIGFKAHQAKKLAIFDLSMVYFQQLTLIQVSLSSHGWKLHASIW